MKKVNVISGYFLTRKANQKKHKDLLEKGETAHDCRRSKEDRRSF
jgi:hypothetical protein